MSFLKQLNFKGKQLSSIGTRKELKMAVEMPHISSLKLLLQSFTSSNTDIIIWAAIWQNQQSDCVPSEDSDQPGHPPSLIRVFAVRMKKPWVLSYPLSAQRRLWSDWADAQADLSLRWVHSHFVGFFMSRLIYIYLWGVLHYSWMQRKHCSSRH